MRIKRFIAKDLNQAMLQIKAEFGSEAVILSSRDLKDGLGDGVEVTAGVKENLSGKNIRLKSKTPITAATSAYQKTAGALLEVPPILNEETNNELILAEVKNLSRAVDEIKELILNLAHRQNLTEKWRKRTDLIRLYRQMVDSGLSQENARFLVETAAENEAIWGGTIKNNVIQYLKTAIKSVDLSDFSGKALALVGPSGSGKTTSLVKLAAWFKKKGRSVGLVSLDTIKLGGTEQLKQYARIMGLSFKICQSQEQLQETMDIFDSLEIVLIDTSSRYFSNATGRSSLTSYLTSVGAQVLLTLSVGQKVADLEQAIAKAVSWPLLGLIISKLDETEDYGNLINLLLGSVPPLAFFSSGPKVPEDWALASQNKLGQLWLASKANDLEIL